MNIFPNARAQPAILTRHSAALVKTDGDENGDADDYDDEDGHPAQPNGCGKLIFGVVLIG